MQEELQFCQINKTNKNKKILSKVNWMKYRLINNFFVQELKSSKI
jgi:hypothetical protein